MKKTKHSVLLTVLFSAVALAVVAAGCDTPAPDVTASPAAVSPPSTMSGAPDAMATPATGAMMASPGAMPPGPGKMMASPAPGAMQNNKMSDP